MTDLRNRNCGECDHYRPGEEGTGICGGALPEVKIWGQILNPETGTIDPLFGTFRPEVKETDPSCFKFSEQGETEDETPRVPKRSRLCKVPGCGCMRDGESDYCADHEDMEGKPSYASGAVTGSFPRAECSLEMCPYSVASCEFECEHPVDERGRSDVGKPVDGTVSSEPSDQTDRLSPA